MAKKVFLDEPDKAKLVEIPLTVRSYRSGWSTVSGHQPLRRVPAELVHIRKRKLGIMLTNPFCNNHGKNNSNQKALKHVLYMRSEKTQL